MVFYDPAAQAVRTLSGGDWPFGMQLIPRVNDGLKDAIRAGDIDQLSLSKLWSQGDWRDFKELLEPFETSLGSGLSRLFGSKRSNPAKLAAKDAPFQHLMLALCHLANGDAQTCDFLLKARHAAMERMNLQGDLGDNRALELFIDVVILMNRGRRDEAKTLAARMLQDAPRNRGVIALYCKLMGADPLRYWPKEMRAPFPATYALPQHDPFGQWPKGGTVKLEDCVANMAPGQLLLVYSLGWYRTNGVMQREMDALIALHRLDPDRFAAVHLITAIDNPKSYWIDKNQIEDGARAAGVPLQVLFDKDDTLAGDLELQEAPSLFVLDHKARVLSMELLADEQGYWQALSVKSQLDKAVPS